MYERKYCRKIQLQDERAFRDGVEELNYFPVCGVSLETAPALESR